MANIDSPFGFTPIGTSDGSSYHGKLREVEFLASDATPAAIGDMLKLTGTTGTDGFTPVVSRAAAGDAVIGSLNSLIPDFVNEAFINADNTRLASTARKGMVTFGSDVLYEVQTSNGTITAADFGQNIDLAVGTASPFTGSGSSVDVATIPAAGATAQFRLRRVAREIDNELAEFARVIVNINESQDDHGVGV